MKDINRNILSDITVHMKYARYIPEIVTGKQKSTSGRYIT